MYVLKHLILAALRIVTGNGKSPAYIGIWLEILNTLYSVCHAAAAMSGENIDCFPGQINVFQERAGWLANCISPDGQNKPYCIIPGQIFRISSDLRLNVVFLLAYDHSDGVLKRFGIGVSRLNGENIPAGCFGYPACGHLRCADKLSFRIQIQRGIGYSIYILRKCSIANP